MSKKLKLFSKRFLARLCQVLGITPLLTAFGCNSFLMAYGVIQPDPGAVCMYGVPGNYFTLEVTVVDEEDKPIPHIQLELKTNKNDSEEYVYPDEEHYFSDENGKYKLHWNDYDSENLKFIIDVKDIDGEENGAFNDKTINVEFSDNTKTGTTSFGNGEYKTNMKIKLTNKEGE